VWTKPGNDELALSSPAWTGDWLDKYHLELNLINKVKLELIDLAEFFTIFCEEADIMEMKSKAKTSQSKQEKLNELHAQQEKLQKLQDELGVIESKIEKDEKLSKEDVKFAAELGWLSAAAVTIASIATSV